MGICASTRVDAAAKAKAQSARIDRQLEDDARKLKKEYKILLLGSGESGKTTIVKQMRIIHQQGFTKLELTEFAMVVHRNLVESAQAIATLLRQRSVTCEEPSNEPHVDAILAYQVDPEALIPPDLANAIFALYRDPAIPPIVANAPPSFYLMDNAPYFFKEARRIGAPGYTPTEEDILRVRKQSTGVAETRFKMGPLSIHMFDVGGQRSERKKWIHCFENVSSIIFCTALSEYDQTLLEAPDQNRMVESIELFKSIINSRWFLRTSIIFFMNKMDVFRAKLPHSPLKRIFPEYSGGDDINKAAKYIYYRFMQVNRAKLPVYAHLTQATDTGNIQLVFLAVKETLIQNALKTTGVL